MNQPAYSLSKIAISEVSLRFMRFNDPDHYIILSLHQFTTHKLEERAEPASRCFNGFQLFLGFLQQTHTGTLGASDVSLHGCFIHLLLRSDVLTLFRLHVISNRVDNCVFQYFIKWIVATFRSINFIKFSVTIERSRHLLKACKDDIIRSDTMTEYLYTYRADSYDDSRWWSRD